MVIDMSKVLIILIVSSDETIVADNRLSIVFGSSISIIDFISHNRLSPEFPPDKTTYDLKESNQ